MSPTRIAVLMTSHNRREKTLAALDALDGQRALPDHTAVRTCLVDAGSTDGTPEAVRAAHPRVEITRVGTDVFWGHGMRIASRISRRAAGSPWDYQLWLNDDVVLDGDALALLLGTAAAVGRDAVIVGAVRSSDGSRTTYSGRRGRCLAPVEPSGRPEPCDTYNGNVVLLPRAVCERVGDIDKVFRHGMGDYDHGFRVRRAGIPVYVTARHVGTCDHNPPGTGSREPGIGVREALRRVTSQHELPPRQWWVYCWRHTWPWAPLLMVSPYVKAAVRAARAGGKARATKTPPGPAAATGTAAGAPRAPRDDRPCCVIPGNAASRSSFAASRRPCGNSEPDEELSAQQRDDLR